MALDSSLPPIPDDELREWGCTVIRGWLPAEEARQLYVSVEALPIHSVYANTEGTRFGTQHIGPGTPAANLLWTSALQITREKYAPEAHLDRVETWISAYRPGEYIDSHRDREGSVQLLVCLDNSAERGGETVLSCLDATTRTFLLQPGDALVFRAREVYHWTTPVRSRTATERALRTVAVGRYFFRGMYPDEPRRRSRTPGT